MFRLVLTLFVLLFVEMGINDFQQFAFADDGEEEEVDSGSESESESDGEENAQEDEGSSKNVEIPRVVKEKHVRSIVDSFLKINKNIDHTKKRSLKKKVGKKDVAGEEEENSDDGEDGDDDEEEDANENGKNDEKVKKTSKRGKRKYRRKRISGGRESAYSLRKIYTVKKVPLFRGSTTYLNYSGGGNNGGYRIKSYGNITKAAKIASTVGISDTADNEKNTVKEVDSQPHSRVEYTKTTSCFSSDGCQKI